MWEKRVLGHCAMAFCNNEATVCKSNGLRDDLGKVSASNDFKNGRLKKRIKIPLEEKDYGPAGLTIMFKIEGKETKL